MTIDSNKYLHGKKHPGSEKDVPYGSNEIRLSLRQWIRAIVIVLAVLFALPRVWKEIEPFEPGPDYRIPHVLSDDYWVFQRLIESVRDTQKIVVIGDSVIWGEYVTPGQTFSHALNELTPSKPFVNGGVNGTHPLALEGLIRHYAKDLTDTRVILHCNLLWLSSPERDLQTRKEIPFNHPRLVSQLFRRIPAYRASASRRLGIIFDRHTMFRRWVNHLRVAWFDSLDVHTWTIDHPSSNPLSRISGRLPEPSTELRHKAISWSERGIERQDLPWIEFSATDHVQTSLQWGAFVRTVELLQKRRNRVFVIVGPFNEHMLTDDSRRKYREIHKLVEDWLHRNQVAHTAFPLLPDDEFADASHPLSAGYTRLAEHLFESATFRQWLGDQSKTGDR